MLAMIEGYPNTEAIAFYLLVGAILFVSLYRFHKKAG